MRNVNCVVLSAADTASANGTLIDANQLVSASFQAVFGDVTAVGTVKVQMSNDICNAGYAVPGLPFAPVNWTDIPSATSTVTAGVAATPITIAQTCYRWMRVVFTRTSGGSTTVIVTMNALSC
jgi:hypothetical protein